MSEDPVILYAVHMRHTENKDSRGHWGFAYYSRQHNWHLWWLRHNQPECDEGFEIKHRLYYHEEGEDMAGFISDSKTVINKHELSLVALENHWRLEHVLNNRSWVSKEAGTYGWYCKVWARRIVHILEDELVLEYWKEQPYYGEHQKACLLRTQDV